MTFENLVHIIIFVNLALTIELWRSAARRPEKPKKKFYKRLFDTKPITPKHQPPPREVERPTILVRCNPNLPHQHCGPYLRLH
jgi:hypothetical protein